MAIVANITAVCKGVTTKSAALSPSRIGPFDLWKSASAGNSIPVFLMFLCDNGSLAFLSEFAKRHWIEKDEVKKMLEYDNSGFSLDAKVKIESWDREGLEQLIMYCARSCFAGENLRWNGPSESGHASELSLGKSRQHGLKFLSLCEHFDKSICLYYNM